MPTNYQFLKKSGEAARLSDIDKEICEYTGEKVNKKDYSGGYYFVTISGIALLNRNVNERIEEKSIDRFCDEVHEGKYKELLKEFLIRRYIFNAWWSGATSPPK